MNSISRYRTGDPRFGLERDEPANGPVETYTLTSEEIAAKYGAPKVRPNTPYQEKQIVITREELTSVLRRSQSWSIAMKELGIGRHQMLRLMEAYQINPGSWKNKKEENQVEAYVPSKDETTKTRYEIGKDLLPRERMINLKTEGKTDKKIYEQLNIAADVFYRLKREYGLMDEKQPAEEPEKLLTIEEALKLRDELRSKADMIDEQLATIRIKVV